MAWYTLRLYDEREGILVCDPCYTELLSSWKPETLNAFTMDFFFHPLSRTSLLSESDCSGRVCGKERLSAVSCFT